MSDVDRIVAAWSFLAQSRDVLETADQFPDMAEHGFPARVITDLWDVELDATAAATRARARDAKLDLQAARVELAYSRIARACEDAIREHGLTVSEAAAAAATVAAVLTASDGSGPAEGGCNA